MEQFDKIPFWRRDYEKICGRIRERPATLKIVVKAKDETHFFSDWIAYHSAIVGPENLIVFDNMSTDVKVAAIYEELSKDILLVRYTGFHNNIHKRGIFPELYSALEDSCKYFLFIDTDEFLTYIGNDKTASPKSVVRFLADSDPVNIHPGTWLYNAPLSQVLFRCGSVGELEGGLRWGKPIVRAGAKISGLHNSELPSSMYSSSTPLCFFILHMVNLYPDQRIAVNLRKMVARGLIQSTDTVESVLSRDWTSIEDNIVKIYVSEMGTLTNGLFEPASYGSKGLIKIERDSKIDFPSFYEEQAFDAFRSGDVTNAIKRILIDKIV